MNRLLAFAILLSLLLPMHAELEAPLFETDISKWMPVDKTTSSEDPATEVPFLSEANSSNHEWKVFSADSKISVSKYDELATSKELPFNATILFRHYKTQPFQVVRVEGGWIAGYNMGEFGAAIYWFNSNGTQRLKLSDHQVNEFIVVNKRIFAAEGLAHLSLSEGSIIEIKRVKQSWQVHTFQKLSMSAEAITLLSDGSFAIITSNSILKLTPNKELTTLATSKDWCYLYPNSIAADEKYIYVGMRAYVARLSVGGKESKVEFLSPK